MRVQETDEICDLAEKSRVEESAPQKRFYRLTTLGRLPSMDETDGWLYPSAPSHASRLRPDSRRMTADKFEPAVRCRSYSTLSRMLLLLAVYETSLPQISKLSIRVSAPGTPPQSSHVVLGFIPQACLVASLVLFRRGIASWNSTIGYQIRVPYPRHIQSPWGDNKAKL